MSLADPGYFNFTTVEINRIQQEIKDKLEQGRRYEEVITRFRKQGFNIWRPAGLGHTILQCKICGQPGASQSDVKHKELCPMADITEQKT